MAPSKQLAERLTPIIKNIARRFEADAKRAAMDVEDLEQEAWTLVASIPRKRVMAARKPEQYLAGCIRNHFLKLVCQQVDTCELTHEPEDAPQVSSDDLSRDVATAIYELPPLTAMVLRMFYGLDCDRHTIPEIADVLKCSRQRIDKLLRTTRDTLTSHPLLKSRWQKAF